MTRAGGRVGVFGESKQAEATKRYFVHETPACTLVFQPRPKTFSLITKEKSSTNHEAPPISRDPRRVVRAGRLPLLPRRPRGGEFFVHERSGGRGPTADIHTAVGTIQSISTTLTLRLSSLASSHLYSDLSTSPLPSKLFIPDRSSTFAARGSANPRDF